MNNYKFVSLKFTFLPRPSAILNIIFIEGECLPLSNLEILDLEKDIKLFQLSLNDDSEKQHTVTFQDHSIKFALTNFVEGMGPFVHVSLMPAFVEFWKYHEVKSGWGFDIVMSSILKAKTAVIHEVSMHHVPKHNPYYDKSVAFAEMYDIMNNVYPKFMKEYYNEEVEAHKEDQKVIGFSFNTV